jgi:starch synthase (maltosyl-transferring)
VYGPAFELCEHRAREPGSEEYLDSEKYQLRYWNREAPGNLRPVLTRLNHIRAAHPALQSDRSLFFHDVDGDGLLCYSKRTRDHRDVVLCVVNVEPTRARSGLVHLDLAELGLREDEPFMVRDLLGGGLWEWEGPEAYVELHPDTVPAHVFAVEAPETRRAP